MTSENPESRPFDLFAQTWMEAVTGGDIDLQLKAFLQKKFNADEIKRIEAATWIVLDEQIYVTRRGRFSA